MRALPSNGGQTKHGAQSEIGWPRERPNRAPALPAVFEMLARPESLRTDCRPRPAHLPDAPLDERNDFSRMVGSHWADGIYAALDNVEVRELIVFRPDDAPAIEQARPNREGPSSDQHARADHGDAEADHVQRVDQNIHAAPHMIAAQMMAPMMYAVPRDLPRPSSLNSRSEGRSDAA